MSNMSAREILSELKKIGAVGTGTPPSALKQETIAIEQGIPSGELIDERGQSMIEACEKAIASLDRMLEAQQELRQSLVEMLYVWSDEEDSGAEEPVDGETNLTEEDDVEPLMLTRRTSPPPSEPEIGIVSESEESIDAFLQNLEENQASFVDEA